LSQGPLSEQKNTSVMMTMFGVRCGAAADAKLATMEIAESRAMSAVW
jgi:hypothetical protein